MGTSNLRHHQANLKGPVLSALSKAQDEIRELVAEGPTRYAIVLGGIAKDEVHRHELTRRILNAIADTVGEYANEVG